MASWVCRLRGLPGPRYSYVGIRSTNFSVSNNLLDSTSAVYGIKCVLEARICLPDDKLVRTAVNYRLPANHSNRNGPIVGNRNPPTLRCFNNTKSPDINCYGSETILRA